MLTLMMKASCAVESCQKAVFSAAMAVMAISAWAVEYASPVYDFELSVLNVPAKYAKMTSGSTVYVMQGDSVLAYATVAEMIDFKYNGVTSVDHASAVVTIDGQDYEVGAHQLVKGTAISDITQNGTRYNTGFNVVFKLSEGVDNPIETGGYTDLGNASSHLYITSESGTKGPLAAILEGQAVDADENVVDDIYERGVIGTTMFAGALYKGVTSVTVESIELNAFDARMVYDGTSTNATYTVDQEGVEIKVAYSEDDGKTWTDKEKWDPEKFTEVTAVLARFTATKKSFETATATAEVLIEPRPVTVKAPNRKFSIDAEDDAIDADIEANVDVEVYDGGENARGLVGDDKITYMWAREEGSFKGSREEGVSYMIAFPTEGDEYKEANATYQGNYKVTYVGGTLTFEEEKPVVCPKCLCLCCCDKRTYVGTIYDNDKALTGTITLTMKKSTKAGYADITATVKTIDGKTLMFKKDGVMICGCRDTTCTTKTSCVSKCGFLGLFSSLGSRKVIESVYDYSKELGVDVEFYEGWGECKCGCGSEQGHGECKTWKGDGRCYWAKKGRKCHQHCCKYDFGFGKSECDFSHYDYTGCYKTKISCDWGKIGCDWDKYVCDWNKGSCGSSKKSCTTSKSVCSLFKSFCMTSKSTCWSKSSCTTSKTKCCAKPTFCWKKFTCKPVCVKTPVCCKKTECDKPETRCIVLNPLVIEMAQTGLSFRQSATHALTVSIVGDSMEGTLFTSDAYYTIKGGRDVDLQSGDPKAEAAKNCIGTYIAIFSKPSVADVETKITIQVRDSGEVAADGTIDGVNYSGVTKLQVGEDGSCAIPVVLQSTAKRGSADKPFAFVLTFEIVDDVVDMCIANMSQPNNGNLLEPAELKVQSEVAQSVAFGKRETAVKVSESYGAPALFMGGKRFGFLTWMLED